jgi:hypothetical protein
MKNKTYKWLITSFFSAVLLVCPYIVNAQVQHVAAHKGYYSHGNYGHHGYGKYNKNKYHGNRVQRGHYYHNGRYYPYQHNGVYYNRYSNGRYY